MVIDTLDVETAFAIVNVFKNESYVPIERRNMYDVDLFYNVVQFNERFTAFAAFMQLFN